MTHNLTTAIVQMIREDPVLSELLTDYHGVPAVFTFAPYPEDATKPLIITEGNVREVMRDSKTTIGREITRDIRIYDNETADPTTIEWIAQRVIDLFHKREQVLQYYLNYAEQLEAYYVVKCWVDGPRATAHVVDEYVQGRIVTLTIWITRKQETMPWQIT
jgi:hypothetical protein